MIDEAILAQVPKIVRPQDGPQKAFLITEADIAIYGGAAGGGKSFALLLEPLYYINNKDFGAVIFRRNATQVRNQGGLWDESYALYSPLHAHPREAYLEWIFPSGMPVKFAHLENEHTVYDWQGAQIPYIGFDELVHFTEKQFWYMLSRNRSISGIPGYIRATCNPDVDSWVRKLVDWWIGEDGYPIQKRSGVIRWFVRINDEIIWENSKEALELKYGKESYPKSFTFIPAKITDNKILLEKDPAYMSNLNALSRVERLRLKDGNWNVRASAGTMFRKEWFKVIDAAPGGWTQICRYWDRAATRPNENNKDPDWTRGLKLYKYPNGTFVVVDLKSIQGTPGEVEDLVKNTASHDTKQCLIVGEQDPGSAGVADALNFVKMLAGYNVQIRKPTKDKITRAKPVSAQVEVGNISVLRAGWNDAFFKEVENFPEGAHDDIVDVLSGSFNELASGGLSLFDV
jgi:predicted phage terminase large subunit-like protein